MFSGSTIGSGALSGADAAGGTATLSIIDYGGALVDLLQPSWTAAAKLWDWATFTVQVVPRVHVPVAPLTISYVLASGTEFVRVAPDGQTPIQITLLDPHLAAFQTVTVKKVNVDVNSTVTIVAADGSTIDGVLSYPLPATPYSVSHFTSDGSFWWGTS